MAGKTLVMYDENGNLETVYVANIKDRVKKDGAQNSHKVIDKLARYKGDNVRALATVHLSEALLTSDGEVRNNEHSHQWMDTKGWIFRKTYLQDRKGNIYEATLNIADGKNGKTIYDINNIKKIDLKKEVADGDVPSNVSERGSHINSNFSNRISQAEASVNRKNSISSLDAQKQEQLDIIEQTNPAPNSYYAPVQSNRKFSISENNSENEIRDEDVFYERGISDEDTAAELEREEENILPLFKFYFYVQMSKYMIY